MKTSERHEVMGPIVVERPKMPMDWAAYVFQASSRCSRCRKMFTVEYWLPSRLLSLIPDDKRDEALRVMSDFTAKRAKYLIELTADGRIDPDDPDPPPCKERN